MATFVKVAKADDVEPGCRKSFEVNGTAPSRGAPAKESATM